MNFIQRKFKNEIVEIAKQTLLLAEKEKPNIEVDELAENKIDEETGEFGKLTSDEYESLDLIVKNKGLKIYRDMQYDDQVKFCLTIKKFLVLSGGYTLTAFDETPTAKEQLDFVQKNFDELDKPFSKVLFDFFSAFDYGFCIAEKIWRWGNFKKEKDTLWLKNIKSKLPWNVDFYYDDYGNLNKILINGEEMPMQKFIIYSFMEEFGNKKGTADSKGSYNAWWFKNNAWKFFSRHLERYGSPIAKGKIPQGATKEETKKFFALINRIHNITGILLPRAKTTGESFEVDLLESKREGGNQFVQAIENADNRIARGYLFPALFGSTSLKFGSYALGEKHYSLVKTFIRFLQDSFAEEVVNKQIINDLIDKNFSEKKYPKFKLSPPPEDIVQQTVDELNKEKNGK